MAEVSAEKELSFWSVTQRLQSEGLLCDIQLCVPSTDDPDLCDIIYTHKVVLVASSLFFQSALQSGDLLNMYNFVGISYENLQLVVDYMYRRKTLEELLANREAAFAAQCIQLLSHEVDVGSGNVIYNDGADAVGNANHTDNGSEADADGSTSLQNSCLEVDAGGYAKHIKHDIQVKIGNIAKPNKSDSGEHPNSHIHDGDVDALEGTSRCMTKQEPDVRESVEGDDTKSCGDNALADDVSGDAQISEYASSQKQLDPHDELGEKISMHRVGSESDGEQVSVPKPEMEEDLHSHISVQTPDVVQEIAQGTDSCSGSASKLEPANAGSRSGSENRVNGGDSSNKSVSAEKLPQQKCVDAKSPRNKQASFAVQPKLAPMRNSKLILKSNYHCPKPSTPVFSSVKTVIETPREGLSRSTQRRRKILNYKLLAEGLDISDEDAPQDPDPISRAPPQPLHSVGIDSNAVVSASSNFTMPTITGKRKRGRPRKLPVADVVVQETGEQIITGSDKRLRKDGAIGEDASSRVEAIKDEGCRKTDEVGVSNINPVESSKDADIDEHDGKIGESVPSLKYLKPPWSDSAVVPCGNCVRTFKSKSALVQHRKIIHGVKLLYGCTTCGAEVESMHLLNMHKKDVHQMAMYGCSKCVLQFKTREGLKMHNHKKHSGAKPTFKCEFCEKAFFLKGELKNHVQFHSEERNFLCDRCSRAFKSKSLLVRHTNTFHSNARNFQCDVCGVMFKTRNDCKAHRVKHFRTKNPIMANASGARKRPEKNEYPCQFCGKVFKKRPHQLVHENLQHKQKTDGNAYMCTVCSKVFPICHYLKQHIKNCHSKRRFGCQKCFQMFAQRGDLRKHESVPGRCKGVGAEPKPFNCPHCSKGFSLKGNLSKHLQNPERCRGQPTNRELIVVLSSDVTLTSEGVMADMKESAIGESILVVPPGEDGGSQELEADSIVQIEEGGMNVTDTYELNSDNKVEELQGLVNGKLVPISMTTVDGQYEFTISGVGDLNDTQVVYQITDPDITDHHVIHMQDDIIMQDSTQDQGILGGDISSHITQDGEVIAEIVLQDDASRQTIVSNDTHRQAIVNNVSEQAIVADDISGQTIVCDDAASQVIVSDDISGQAIVSDDVSGHTIIGDAVNGQVIVDDNANGQVIIADDVSGQAIFGDDVNGQVIVSDDISGQVIVGDDVSGHIIVGDDVSGQVTVSDDVSGHVIVGDDVSGQVIVGDDVSGQVIVGDDVSGQVIHLFEENVLVNDNCEGQQIMETNSGMDAHPNINESHCHSQVQEVTEEVISVSEPEVHIMDTQLILEPQEQEVTDHTIEVMDQIVEGNEEVMDQRVEVNQEVIHVDNVIYLGQSDYVETKLVDE